MQRCASRPESAGVGEGVEGRGDAEEDEQRQTVDDGADVLGKPRRHRQHPPHTDHTRTYPQLQSHIYLSSLNSNRILHPFPCRQYRQ